MSGLGLKIGLNRFQLGTNLKLFAQIRTQQWGNKNLNISTTAMGNTIPNVTANATWTNSTNLYNAAYAAKSGTIAEKNYEGLKAAAMLCYPNNNIAFFRDYGYQYNHYAIELIQADISIFNAINQLSVIKYRISKSSDWTTLITYLTESLAAGKLKETGTAHWNSPNTGATDEFKFSMLPTAYRTANGTFNAPPGGTGVVIDLDKRLYLFQTTSAMITLFPNFDRIAGGAIRTINTVANNILIFGNSITKHPITSYWWGEYGMAASCRENDFLHRLQSKIRQYNPLCFVSSASDSATTVNSVLWEKNHSTYDLSLFDSNFTTAPEIVIIRLGENVTDVVNLGTSLATLYDYIKTKAPYCRVIVSGMYWGDSAKEVVLSAFASSKSLSFVQLSHLNTPENNSTIGAIVKGDDGQDHAIDWAAVAAHPGDLGMEAIANALFNIISI